MENFKGLALDAKGNFFQGLGQLTVFHFLCYVSARESNKHVANNTANYQDGYGHAEANYTTCEETTKQSS